MWAQCLKYPDDSCFSATLNLGERVCVDLKFWPKTSPDPPLHHSSPLSLTFRKKIGCSRHCFSKISREIFWEKLIQILPSTEIWCSIQHTLTPHPCPLLTPLQPLYCSTISEISEWMSLCNHFWAAWCPRHVFLEKKNTDDVKDEAPECVLCQQEIRNETKTKVECCGKYFHFSCLFKNVLGGYGQNARKCPACRSEFPEYSVLPKSVLWLRNLFRNVSERFQNFSKRFRNVFEWFSNLSEWKI